MPYTVPKHLSMLEIIAFIIENTPQRVGITQTINPLRKRLVRHVLLPRYNIRWTCKMGSGFMA